MQPKLFENGWIQLKLTVEMADFSQADYAANQRSGCGKGLLPPQLLPPLRFVGIHSFGFG